MTTPIPLPVAGPISLENWGSPLTQRVNDLSSSGMSRGYRGGNDQTATITPGATETNVISVTFTTAIGRRYSVHADGAFQGSVASSLATFRFRWAPAGSASSSDTQMGNPLALHAAVINQNFGYSFERSFVATGTQATVALTIQGANTSANFSAGLSVGRIDVYDVNV